MPQDKRGPLGMYSYLLDTTLVAALYGPFLAGSIKQHQVQGYHLVGRVDGTELLRSSDSKIISIRIGYRA
jgi:hypothetical protein